MGNIYIITPVPLRAEPCPPRRWPNNQDFVAMLTKYWNSHCIYVPDASESEEGCTWIEWLLDFEGTYQGTTPTDLDVNNEDRAVLAPQPTVQQLLHNFVTASRHIIQHLQTSDYRLRLRRRQHDDYER